MEERGEAVSGSVKVGQTVRLSFGEVLRNVRRQICLTAEYRGLYSNAELAEDIAKIMTEVYMMPGAAEILVSGERIPCYLVREVLEEVTSEHVAAVIDAFCRVDYEIKAKKQYLRTALYNSVFEAEAAVVNDYNVKTGGGLQ